MLVSFVMLAGIYMSCTPQKKLSLLEEARRYFTPLPSVFSSHTNPVTPPKVKLGKMLFYEKRLSAGGNISCARCHPIEYYGTDRLTVSKEEDCKNGTRNVPSILNAAGQELLNWIGNRISIEKHARKALLNKVCTGKITYRWVVKRLKGIPEYEELFRRAFPEDKNPININNISRAIGAWERTLLTPSRFDRFLKGEVEILSIQEKRGLRLFIEKGCASCHTGMLLGGTALRKFGVVEPYWRYTGSKHIDKGRYNLTSNPEDRFVFKVPILRNVEKTSPYFHDGSVKDLKEAIKIMGKIQLGINLSTEEIDSIEAFLKSLTGEIPEEVRKLPVMP